jgi:hypothetical protein
MIHSFTFIKSRALLYFAHWSLWVFTVDEMQLKTAFTSFTLDESSAMHIQSVKCKFALRANLFWFLQADFFARYLYARGQFVKYAGKLKLFKVLLY